MADDTTAPVTAEGLRERLTEVVTRWALMYPLANWPWPGRTLAGDDADRLDALARDIAAAWGRDIADRVLDALAADHGDLAGRMAWEIRNTECEHLGDGGACSRCRATAALSVRDEHAAHLAARLAQAEARAEHAEGQLSARRDHETRWELEHRKRMEAEAAIERVKAIPPTPQDTDIDATVNRIYRQGWESVIDAIDRALATPDAPTEETDRV